MLTNDSTQSIAELDDCQLGALVNHFYAMVRRDPLIGDVFNRVVADWEDHLTTLTNFWSSVMLGSGRYKGNPVAHHVKLADEITPAMFDRWLVLWREATSTMCTPSAAAQLQAKATRIAESLQLAIELRPGAPARGRKPLPVMHPPGHAACTPYRSTPIFDQDTLPAALRADHRTKAGVWGMVRVLDGSLRLHLTDPDETIELHVTRPGLLRPGQTHYVEIVGPMRMQVDFYDQPPQLP